MDPFSLGMFFSLQLAVKEVTFLGAREVSPAHMLLGMLKLLDSRQELTFLLPDLPKDELEGLRKELDSLQALFQGKNLDITKTRRGLRQQLPREGYAVDPETLMPSRELARILIRHQNPEKEPDKYSDLLRLFIMILEINDPVISSFFPVSEYHAPIQREHAKGEISNLLKYGRELTHLAAEGKLRKVIGRQGEIKTLGRILLQQNKRSALLIGEAGVGKTAVVEGLAIAIHEKKVPEALHNKKLIELSQTALLAGTSLRGELESRFEHVLKEAAENDEVILFIDEIHTLLKGAGSGADLSNMLKPALARGDIRLIGATTTREFRQFIEVDQAFERRFQKVFVDPPDPEDTIAIIQGLRPTFEQHYQIGLPDEAIQCAVRMAERYLPDLFFPDKAIDIIDAAFSARVFNTSVFEGANSLYGAQEGGQMQIALQVADIQKAVALQSHLPVEHLQMAETEKVKTLEAYLNNRVLGQNEAVKSVCDALKVAKVGLGNPNRPIAVLLFVGPTGVGKTMMAKEIARHLLGDPAHFLQFDMSEYMERHQLSKLIGAPPGYVGSEEEGQLIRQVRSHPHCVLLFDEIEKAHPDIFPIFLQIFEEGHLMGNHQRKASFKSAILVLTSNLGSHRETDQRKPLGFQPALPPEPTVASAAYLQAVKSHFAPELINRIDRIIPFAPINREDAEAILDSILDEVAQRLASSNIEVRLTQAARQYLLDCGFSPEYGVRQLDRTVKSKLSTPIADLILDRQSRDMVIHADAGEEGLRFSIPP